jgi:hypothetical protein
MSPKITASLQRRGPCLISLSQCNQCNLWRFFLPRIKADSARSYEYPFNTELIGILILLAPQALLYKNPFSLLEPVGTDSFAPPGALIIKATFSSDPERVGLLVGVIPQEDSRCTKLR